MAIQTVFSNNLDPASPNLSERFIGATAFYIAAPLINAELEIDCYLQVYFPAAIGEQIRNIPLGKISEQSILLNISDTETASVIPQEFLDTGLEMALLFLASSSTFIQAAIIKPNCTVSDVCNSLELVNQRLTAIENALSTVPNNTNTATTQQQQFFGLQ